MLAACSAGDDAPDPDRPEAAVRTDDQQAAREDCDPLATDAQPAELGDVLAVGQAEDDTFYVVSQLSGEGTADLVYVSQGEVLQRQRVTGSGGSGSGADEDFTASFSSAQGPSRLVVKRRGGAVVGMALVHDAGRSFYDALPEDAVALRVLSPDTVRDLPLQNLPGGVVLEFIADASDGSTLILTRPEDDWGYEDFRVFYGRFGVFLEGDIGDASRGGSTYLDFVVDETAYSAVLGSPPFAAEGSSRLIGPSGSQTLTLADVSNGLPEGARFSCLRGVNPARPRP